MILLAALISSSIFFYFKGKTFDSAYVFDYSVTSRFQETLELIETKKYSIDASTSYRVAEIINVFGMLYHKLPYTLPLDLEGMRYFMKIMLK